MDSKTILSIIAILFMVVIMKIVSDKFKPRRGNGDQKKFGYKITVNDFQIRPSLLNSNERVFFEQLKLAVGGVYDIYPQVQLGAIFQPIKQWHNRGELSRLNKRIDFVLFDKNTQTPKIAIELDGDSHSNYKSFNRDEFVGQIFQKFNIPLIRFNNGAYSAEEIKNKFSSF
jgi:hypothetical protein